MSDEKKNLIVGSVLIVGALVVLYFLFRPGSLLLAQPVATSPDATAEADPNASYINYNLPPYNSSPNGNVPAVVINSGGCDCNRCGPYGTNSNTTSNIDQFLAYMPEGA